MFSALFESSNYQEVLNFNYSVSMPADKEYGLTNDNVTWSGMVGMLMKNEADIGEEL